MLGNKPERKKKLSEFAGVIKDEKFAEAVLGLRQSHNRNPELMEGKKIKRLHIFPEEYEINENEIKRIKKRLHDLKEDITELNDFRDRWTDLDVAVVCWLLAHYPDELELWIETKI